MTNQQIAAAGSTRVEQIIETTSSDQWRATIRLHGELDAANAATLRRELDRHLDAGRRVLHIDTAAVSFIDSTALGELITASQCCRREHGALILTRVPARMRRVITLAGLEDLLLIDTAPATPSTQAP